MLLQIEGFEYVGFGKPSGGSQLLSLQRRHDVEDTAWDWDEGLLGDGNGVSLRRAIGGTDTSWIRAKTLGASGTAAIGLRFKVDLESISGSGPHQFAALFDGTDQQLTLALLENEVNDDYEIEVYRGDVATGTKIGETVGLRLAYQASYFIELAADIDSSTGSFIVRVNEVERLNVSGVSTQATGNATVDRWGITGKTSFLFDDIYFDDSTLQGELVMEGGAPTGDGATVAWTPSSGVVHHEMVDENPPDDDGTFVSSNANDQIELLTYPALQQITGPILAVTHHAEVKLNLSGSRNVQHAVRSGGVNAFGASQNIADTAYGHREEIFLNDPTDSSPWTVAKVDAAEFGLKTVA